MKLTTTFNKLREKKACTEGYRKLAKHLGGVEVYGADKEINLLTILESNGFDDTVWCLRATLQDSDVTKRLIAADFAESVLHIYELKYPGDERPRKAIKAARDFANGLISNEERIEARKAAANAAAAAATYATAAANAAAAAATYATATDATYAATAAATDAAAATTYATATDATYATAAAYAAARKQKKEQLAEILKRHLSE